IFDQKIMIVLEDSITQPEQLLAERGKEELVEEMHAGIEQAIQPRLSKLIEEVVGVSVVELLSDAKLATKRTGIIAVLSGEPLMRDRVVSPAI
ncbi:MAG TPA: Na-translocating system protein MpsC family protein, partial [Thermosynechococcaceae cyanobacterium]